jgi:DNA-directed RNA polymerase subunit delta
MAIKNLNKKEIAELSNVELAREILSQKEKAVYFSELLKEVNSARGENLEGDALVRFYADLNSDGSFISLGSQEWGLRSWYAVDSIDEATHDGFDDEEEPVAKKKKASATDDEDVTDFEDDDVIDTDDDDSIEATEDDDDSDDDDDEDEEDTTTEGDVALNTDNEELDVVEVNNDLDDLSDGDVEL